MEIIIFSGIQAAGKSSFYRKRFADTHIRINLDMLRTRHREKILIKACLEAKQPFVVDNTNLTVEDRQRYIGSATDAGFMIVGYNFYVDVETAVARNTSRDCRRPVPEKAIRSSLRRWRPITLDEGFDQLYEVRIEAGEFFVDEIMD